MLQCSKCFLQKTMKLKQLSLFLENKPGNVRKACRMLAENGINIETMTLADTKEYGILRLLVQDWGRAKEVFEENGVLVRVADVIALAVGHRPGGLADILAVLDEAGLNIEYMYGFSHRVSIKPPSSAPTDSEIADSAIIVFRFDNPDIAVEALRTRNIRVIESKELFG